MKISHLCKRALLAWLCAFLAASCGAVRAQDGAAGCRQPSPEGKAAQAVSSAASKETGPGIRKEDRRATSGALKKRLTIRADSEAKMKNAAPTSTAEDKWQLPCGNFGLNALCGGIGKAQSAIQKQSGAKVFFDYYAVLLSNPYGGDLQGTDYTHEMIYGLNLDMEKILGWNKANLVISGAYNAGGNLSGKIGNAFTVSESYVANGAMLYQLYIRQNMEICGGELSARLGRVSMSGVFGSLPVLGNLVSGGISGTPEAIFYNSPFTSSPIATWGADMQYSAAKDLSFAAGVYQAPKNLSSPN